MADERRAQLARLRERGRELRAAFSFVEGEYRAGRLSLSEEAALLTDIAREMIALSRRLCAVVVRRRPSRCGLTHNQGVSARDRRGNIHT